MLAIEAESIAGREREGKDSSQVRITQDIRLIFKQI
jgi:hypothetical protein